MLASGREDFSNPSSSYSVLLEVLRAAAPADFARLRQFLGSSGLPETGILKKIPYRTPSGEIVPLVSVVNAYAASFARFRGREVETREAKTSAEASDFVAGTKAFFGKDRLATGFENLDPADVAKRAENAKLADLVIAMRRIAEVVPVAGDVSGGAFDLSRAIAGIDTDGAKLSTLERSFTAAFGVLGISVAGGWARRAHASGKLLHALSFVRDLPKNLPGKIAEAEARGVRLE